MKKQSTAVIIVVSIGLNLILAYMLFQKSSDDLLGGDSYENAHKNAELAKSMFIQIDENSSNFMKMQETYFASKVLDDSILELNRLSIVENNASTNKEVVSLLNSLLNTKDRLNMYISQLDSDSKDLSSAELKKVVDNLSLK